MTTSIQANPQFLNARTLVYTAWDLRRATDSDPAGPGVADYESFRVQQRQAGANMSVDIGKTAVGLMQAWVRGGTRGGQGLYRVDNIDTTAPTADTYLAQLNEAGFSASDPTNPRIDQVVLEILDQQHAGASNVAQTRVITGTPTGGTTLDTRAGAGALSASCIRLADVLIPATSTSVVTANIRDRRPFALVGAIPALNPIDAVMMIPSPQLNTSIATSLSPGLDTTQAAALCYLPRRIVGATRIRFKYSQQSTALTGSFNIGIYDSSGTLIVATGSTLLTGALNTIQNVSATIAATTFEPGNYYVAAGYQTLASGTANFLCAVLIAAAGSFGDSPSVGGVGYRSASGGTSLPNTILAFTDVGTSTSAIAAHVVPIIALSVG